jgi:hypothetical protein
MRAELNQSNITGIATNKSNYKIKQYVILHLFWKLSV